MTDDQLAQAIVAHQLAILDALADRWVEEVGLLAMIENVVSPMRLNRNVPQDVRDHFTGRMKDQMLAICRQCFVEGAVRATDDIRKSPP